MPELSGKSLTKLDIVTSNVQQMALGCYSSANHTNPNAQQKGEVYVLVWRGKKQTKGKKIS